MRLLLSLFCCLHFVALQAYDLDTIESLFQQVRIDKANRNQLNETLELAETFQSEDSRNQIYFEMARMLSYLRDIPVLTKGNYLKNQSQLLWAAAKALKQEEWVSFHEYQTTDNHQNVHFIFDAEDDQKQLAVFKSDGERNAELLTWELSCIFGIEEAITPAIPLTIYGRTGELQAFQKSDLTKDQSNDKSLYGLVTFDSYLKCALSVLLLALHDVHNENCYYQFCREGYIKLGMFDTEMAFDRTSFIPNQLQPEYPSLNTPYCWIGWDFPQRERPITKRFKGPLVNLIGSWPNRIEALKEYFSHSMTKSSLTDDQVQGVIKRALELHQVILKDPEQPVSVWHEKLCPEYPEVAKRLKEFFPEHDTAWILFQLYRYPGQVYQWMPDEKHGEFKAWLEEFFAPK